MPVIEVISTYTAEDTLPVFTRNHQAGAVNITGWIITLRIRRPDQPVLEKVAAIVDGPAGDYSFTFVAGDLVEGQGQEAEEEFNTGSGIFTEASLSFNVRGELG